MSSLLHRKDTELLLKQLKQLNDLDHTEYYCWDKYHWFPTRKDKETEAETTKPEDRTEKQKNILEQKEERQLKETEYTDYFAKMKTLGQTPVSRREFFNGKKG